MDRRIIVALGILLGGTLAFATSLKAHVTPSGPPTLSQAYIIFHTKGDDKDYDSYENVTITTGQWKVGELQNAGAGQVWRDQSDTPPLYLVNVDKGIEPNDCGKLHVDINHSTHGNDNWKFSYTVVLTFTDNSAFTYGHAAEEELTKDNGHGAWDDTKTVSPTSIRSSRYEVRAGRSRSKLFQDLFDAGDVQQMKTIDGSTGDSLTVQTDFPGTTNEKRKAIAYIVDNGFVRSKFDSSTAHNGGGDNANVFWQNDDPHDGTVILEANCSGVNGHAHAECTAAYEIRPAALARLHAIAEAHKTSEK